MTSTITTPPTISTPIPNFLFSVTVNLGQNHLDPIPLREGGIRIVEPIIGGTMYGPAFNATIEGGLAAPIVVSNVSGNGTIAKTQRAFIYVYGHASDGSPFYIEESGLGSRASQTTRMIVQVGGKFQDLQNLYILGQPVINEERTVVQVNCFSVPLPV